MAHGTPAVINPTFLSTLLPKCADSPSMNSMIKLIDIVTQLQHGIFKEILLKMRFKFVKFVKSLLKILKGSVAI